MKFFAILLALASLGLFQTFAQAEDSTEYRYLVKRNETNHQYLDADIYIKVQNSKLTFLINTVELLVKKSLLSGEFKARASYGTFTLKISQDFRNLTYQFKSNETGKETFQTGILINASQKCHEVYGREYCPGTYFTRPAHVTGSNEQFALQVKEILIDQAGKPAAIKTTKGLYSLDLFVPAEPASKRLKCVGNKCLGDEVFVHESSFMGQTLCRSILVGINRHGFIVKTKDNSNHSTCSAQDFVLLKDKVSDTNEKNHFEKIINKSCDDISNNDKQRIFDEESQKAVQSCENSGYHACTSFIQCKPQWGCGYPYWVKAVSDNACSIFGYTRGYFNVPE